jgi:hypothetical protein
MSNILGHLALAVVLQLLAGRLCRNWFAGAAVASAWAISREITQAEYRWIEAYGHGLRANMPWFGRFDPRVWQHADPWVDWLVPTIATFAIAFVLHARRKNRARREPNASS